MGLGTWIALALALQAAEPATFRFEQTDPPGMAGANTMDAEAVDLDGDGDLDLVLAQEFRANLILVNVRGVLTPARRALPQPGPDELPGPPQLRFEGAGHDSEDVAVADFNGDGRPDIVIVSEDDVKLGRTGVHEYFLGSADGFTPVRGVLPDSEANAVVHGDLDGDRRLDLVIAGAGPVILLKGDGKGGFANRSRDQPAIKGVVQDVEAADLDGDGDLDLVFGLEGGHALWLNDGAGRFLDASDRLPDPGDVEARKVAPVDIDGDGDLDLYFSHVGWQGRSPQDRLLINQGGGRFVDETARRIPSERETTVDARFADLDGDGDLDLVRANFGAVTVWLNRGDGVFTDVTVQVLATPVSGPNVTLEIQDFDGDRRPDIYVGQLKGPQGGPGVRDRLLLNRPAAP